VNKIPCIIYFTRGGRFLELGSLPSARKTRSSLFFLSVLFRFRQRSARGFISHLLITFVDKMDQTADLVLKELITLHEDASMSKDVEKNGGIIAAIDISLPCLPPSVQNLFFKNAYIMRIRIRRGLFS